MRLPRRVLLALLSAVLLGVPLLHASAASSDYSNPDYAAYDADNMARTTERQGYHFTTPGYWEASQSTFLSTFLAGQGRQASDVQDGRAYVTVGQLAPGGNVGDPEDYDAGLRYEVEFLNREGAKLVGNVWPCRAQTASGTQAACPGVVITTGSIQVTQHMYGWLARTLQDGGYTVMTFDVRGQGESEMTTHDDATPTPANAQDGANFVNGTVDALRFLLSTPAEPYVPVGWDVTRRAAADELANADDLEWANPAPDAVDRGRLALVGHSLGASAVSTVQQCSNAYPERPLVTELPAGCAGQRFPIRAIAAFDSLSGGVEPVVPAFDHRADGYFVNAVPTPSAPATDNRTGPASPYGQWQAAGVDACSITVRGGTHAEWTEIPYIVSATRYGVPQAQYYVQAWFDRYVSANAAAAGFDALRAGPTPLEPVGQHLEQRASLFSGKYLSACHVASPVAGAPAFAAPDLRAFGGVAAAGDWKAINAEAEHGTQMQGVVHA